MEEKKRYIFIVNPKSGSSDLGTFESIVRKYFDNERFVYDIVVLTNDESLKETLTHALNREFDVIVAAGGDGTIAGVANLMIDKCKLSLGIVPLGTSNALAKELNIPTDLEESIKLLAEGNSTRAIDAMKIGANYYFNRISAGFSSIAVDTLSDTDKQKLGTLGYLFKGFWALKDIESMKFTISINGKPIKTSATDVIVNNAHTLLYSNLSLVDAASIDDGKLEVVLLRSKKLLEHAKVIKDIVMNDEEKDNLVEVIKDVQTITLTCKKNIPIQADGDLIGEKSVTVMVVPKAINIIVPAT